MPLKVKMPSGLLVLAALLVTLGVARGGHEMPVYPSYYPHEIAIETMPPERGAELLRDAKIQAYLGAEPRLPGNLHVSIDRAEAETLILSLGGSIALSSGAACAEAEGKGSHVLRALGLSDERVYTALRLGLGRYNDAGEIDTVVEALAEAVKTARARWQPASS